MHEKLDELTRRLDAARAAQNHEEVARLRLGAVYERLRDRQEGESQPLIEGDVALLVLAAGDLQRVQQHERALEMLAAARGHARRRRWNRWSVRAALYAVPSLVALLDVAAAASLLRETLGLAPSASLTDHVALVRARNLSVRGTATAELQWLRCEALAALGRYLAATGALDAAHRAFTALLAAPPEMPAPNGSGILSVPDVAIRAAAVCIDRGAFADFHQLQRTWFTTELDPELRNGWLLLEGGALAAQGHYSEARDRLTMVAERGVTAGSVRQVQAARWQLAQVLAVLNRMDEAEAIVKALENDGRADYDVDALKALFESRRSGATVAFDPLASPRDMAVGSLFVQEMAPPRAAEKGDEEEPHERLVIRPQRRYERVRDDWAHVANAAQLDLARGDTETAAARLVAVTTWMPAVSSRLLWGRYLRLAALIAHFRGQWQEAASLAGEARARFAELEMPGDEWDASRLRYRALVAAGAPRSDVDAEAQRGQDLLRTMERILDPTDRSLYLLNKWSTVDDAIRARIDALDGMPARQHRRALRQVLQDIADLRRWQSPSRQPGGERSAEPSPPSGTDVFAFVRSQEFSRNRKRRWGERLSLRPQWISRDAAMLHYAVLPTRTEAILMHRGGCERLTISRAVDRRSLFDATRRALRSLTDPGAGTWTQTAGSLSMLAEMLGMPELSHILPDDVRKLAIVLDDVIVHVPFAALPFQGRPLVSRVVPTLIPYARWTGYSTVRARYPSALGVGVRGPRFKVGHNGRVVEYPVLADPTSELSALRQVSEAAPVILSDNRASHRAVVDALQRTAVAHFVCHGDFFAGRPNPSKLLLWDRPLEVPDLQSLALRQLRFVALGACWGADTRVLPGREMVGIPTAFLERGVGEVVASLWELDDASAAEFMRAVYAAMPNDTPSEAVARAQRSWIATRKVTDWACYQMYAAGVPARPLIGAALGLLERILPEVTS